MSIDLEFQHRTQRLEEYENRTSLLMVGLALAYLILYAIQVLVIGMDARWANLLNWISNVIWATFVADLVWRTYLAPRRLDYLWRHPIDVIAALVPAFRALRILRILTAGEWLVQRGSRLAVGRVASSIVLAVSFLALMGSLAVLDAERDAPGANITSFGQALWWAFSTMSTVGYGDVYPITFVGRTVAVGMMVVGVSLLGIVSATLASGFLARLRGEQEVQDDEVTQELKALREEISSLRSVLQSRQ